jgi:hypothetical protein
MQTWTQAHTLRYSEKHVKRDTEAKAVLFTKISIEVHIVRDMPQHEQLDTEKQDHTHMHTTTAFPSLVTCTFIL